MKAVAQRSSHRHGLAWDLIINLWTSCGTTLEFNTFDMMILDKLMQTDFV